MGKKGRRGRKKTNQSSQRQNINDGYQQPTQQQAEQQVAEQHQAEQQHPLPSQGQGPDVQPTHTDIVMFHFASDALVTAVLQRGGLPDYLNSFEKLQPYLQGVFVGAVHLQSFFQILAHALMGTPPIVINEPVPILSYMKETMPLLHWLCQYKFLNENLFCNLTDEIVCLLLRAGADPNSVREEDQTNALFFAIKYGSLKTIDMLIDAGINVQQIDRYGNSCLINALEQSDPKIIRRLLKYLPATEMIQSKLLNGGDYELSLADILLGLSTTPVQPMSWKNMGIPRMENMQETLVLLRQKGSRITEVCSDSTIQQMGIAISKPDHPELKYPRILQELAKTLVGIHIPASCKIQPIEEVSVADLSLKEESKCPICLDIVHKSVTLYCGHSFCRECIVEHGNNNGSCPLCRAHLCPEVSSFRNIKFHNLIGVNAMALEKRGPGFFSNEQVLMEAKAQGINTNKVSCESLRKKLTTNLDNGNRMSRQSRPIVFEINGKKLRGHGRTLLELSCNFDVVMGTPPNSTKMHCPQKGLVSIEVSILGIPLLARISNLSAYTVFSKTLVDQLGLRRIDTLKSDEFVTIQGKKIPNSTFTCLEPVTICFQGIEVTLRNAVEISSAQSEFLTTIQLGLDFLASGLMSVVDVEINGGNYYRVVMDESWPVTNVSKESFRYYTHDGKMAKLPLIHFDPFRPSAVLNAVTLTDGTNYTQCSWCCRVFPEGMLECEGCKGWHYCDRRCQSAAWKIHKKKCGNVSPDMAGGFKVTSRVFRSNT